jgi:hypothetical protein
VLDLLTGHGIRNDTAGFEQLIGKTFAEGIGDQAGDNVSTRHSHDESKKEVWENDLEADAHGIDLSRFGAVSFIISRLEKKTIRLVGFDDQEPIYSEMLTTRVAVQNRHLSARSVPGGHPWAKGLTLLMREGV